MAIDVVGNFKRNWLSVLVAFLAAVAVAALAFYLWTIRDYPAHYVEGTGTVATVTELVDDEEVIYVAHVRFLDSDGLPYSFDGQVEPGTSSGDIVAFRFDPRDPSGTADTPLDRSDSWMVWIGILGLGIFFLITFILGKLTEGPRRDAD